MGNDGMKRFWTCIEIPILQNIRLAHIAHIELPRTLVISKQVMPFRELLT